MRKLLTKLFQKFIELKDIRSFKKNIFYYIFFRIIRSKLDKKIKVKIYNFLIMANYKKTAMSFSILRKCDFDDHRELKLLDKICNHNKIFLFDCGSNFGFYSLYVASKKKENKVIAFEASPATFNEFLENINLNNINSIEAKNLAISNKDKSELKFYESDKNWESSLDHSNFKKKSELSIGSTTLDKVSENQNLANYFVVIKLDVEGHEMKVIDGGLNLIKEYSPLIIIEFSKFIGQNEEFNYYYLENFLKEFDYDIYNVDYKKTELKLLIEQMNKLSKNMYGIGNSFLVKKNSNFEKIMKECQI